MGRRLARFVVVFSVCILFGGQLGAAPKMRITVSQRNIPWTLQVGPADITGGPGSDFAAEYESAVNEKTLDITSPVGNWRLDVRRSDTNWDPNIHIYIRRTGAGVGTGTISGGTTYVEITAADITLFTGTLDRTNIDLQFKVTGAFAANGVALGSYLTTITYTVTDNL